MRWTSSGAVALLAAASVWAIAAAVGSDASSSDDDFLLQAVMTQQEDAANRVVQDAQSVGNEGPTTSERDRMAGKVAEIQGMAETDIKLELRSLYSNSKSAQEKQMFPVGSLEAMQDALNLLAPVDEEARDVLQFLNRYAYLVAKSIKGYVKFYFVKIALGRPKLVGQKYKKWVAELPDAAAEWVAASDLLVAYLTAGANDIRDKWEQRATTERRLREVLDFFQRLADVYEAQQRTFRTAYGIAKLRYLELPDRQADLSLLLNDPRQKSAQLEFDDALENLKEKTHRARKAAASSVKDGIVPSEYLTILPFQPDRQRELDDLPESDDI